MQKSNPKKKIVKEQSQPLPGLEKKMDPQPDFDDDSQGSNKLQDKKCIITGGNSGIGRAVAVAFAKQGADVAIIQSRFKFYFGPDYTCKWRRNCEWIV